MNLDLLMDEHDQNLMNKENFGKKAIGNQMNNNKQIGGRKT